MDKTNSFHTFALISFIFSILFIFAYSNLTLHHAIFICIYYMLPVILISFFSLRSSSKDTISPRLVSVFLAMIVFGFFAVSVVALMASNEWDNLHAFNALENYVKSVMLTDTPMHAVIINSIVRTGFSSTALHGDIFYPYHLATHYYDALFSYVTGHNALDIYGITTFVKTIAFILAVLYFTLKMTVSNNILYVGIHYLLSLVLLVYSGHAIGSHALWLPSILLVLSWPYVLTILEKKFSTKSILILFVIGVIAAFGKVSLGMAFMAMIGLYLFFQNYKDTRVIILGGFWILYLAIFSTFFTDRMGGSEAVDWVQYFNHYKLSYMGLALCGVLAVIKPSGLCRKAFLPIVIYNIVIIATSWIIAKAPEDWGYFALGSMFIASLFTLTDLGKTFGDRKNFVTLFNKSLYFPKTSFSLILTYGRQKRSILNVGLSSAEKYLPLKISDFVAYLSISMIIFAYFSQFPVFDINKNLKTINVFPYRIYNLDKGYKNKKTIIRDVMSGDLGSYKEEMNFENKEIVKFRESLHNFMLQKGSQNLPIFLSKRNWLVVESLVPAPIDKVECSKHFMIQKGTQYPPIFLSKRNSVVVESPVPAPNNRVEYSKHFDISCEWMSALAFSAFIGVPIIYGLPEQYPIYWGYYYYQNQGHRLENLESVNCNDFPAFIDVISIKPPLFEVSSCGP